MVEVFLKRRTVLWTVWGQADEFSLIQMLYKLFQDLLYQILLVLAITRYVLFFMEHEGTVLYIFHLTADCFNSVS